MPFNVTVSYPKSQCRPSSSRVQAALDLAIRKGARVLGLVFACRPLAHLQHATSTQSHKPTRHKHAVGHNMLRM
jgi:hypothetical protein